MLIELQEAWVLHSRPYRDTSLIVDLFTRDYGRLSVVARGARATKSGKPQKNNMRSRLNPFIPLLISCQGKGELMTLTAVESRGLGHYLSGAVLFSAMYVNEVLMRLLPAMDAHPDLFVDYQRVLAELGSLDDADPSPDIDRQALLECLLRAFEFKLLDALGYGIHFDLDADSGARVRADCHYNFYPDRGCVLTTEAGVPGDILLQLADNNFLSPEARRIAKHISRLALKVQLGDKPLKTRELFEDLARGPIRKQE